MQISDKMSSQERKASFSLASIYGLRMLGMFLILPIFAIYATHYKGGDNSIMVGAALGAYGATQALFQLPFGMASDKFGRKKMIVIGLIMLIIGSIIAALATDISMVILGRAVQGAGAVSAAVTALLADLTREEHRTKAMAMIGATIGVTFAISLVLGPAIAHWAGIAGIFWLTAILASLAILVVKFVVPNPVISSFHSDASAAPAKLKDVLKNGQLLRLNYGIFALHAAQMAMFIVVPFAIQKTSNLNVNQHWQVYLPILLGSFMLMIPAIIVGEKRNKLKPVFIGAVALMLVAQLCFASLITSFWGIIFSLFAYFVAFNILEASLPSLISKLAPAAAKGTAMGVYNTSQSLGVAVGGLVGGYLASSRSDIDAAAVQWAIWETAAELPVSGSLATGDIRIIGAANASLVNLANQYLANVNTYAPATLTYLTNNPYQNVVTWNAVPEPTSALLGGLSCLLLLRRRRA